MKVDYEHQLDVFGCDPPTAFLVTRGVDVVFIRGQPALLKLTTVIREVRP